MRVRCYRNLHSRNWTVQVKTPKGWRKYDGVNSITIKDPVFKVSKAGRERCVFEKRKNVHAFIEGEAWYFGQDRPTGITSNVSYNPYKAGEFQNSFGEPVTLARWAHLDKSGSAFYTNYYLEAV